MCSVQIKSQLTHACVKEIGLVRVGLTWCSVRQVRLMEYAKQKDSQVDPPPRLHVSHVFFSSVFSKRTRRKLLVAMPFTEKNRLESGTLGVALVQVFDVACTCV